MSGRWGCCRASVDFRYWSNDDQHILLFCSLLTIIRLTFWQHSKLERSGQCKAQNRTMSVHAICVSFVWMAFSKVPLYCLVGTCLLSTAASCWPNTCIALQSFLHVFVAGLRCASQSLLSARIWAAMLYAWQSPFLDSIVLSAIDPPLPVHEGNIWL